MAERLTAPAIVRGREIGLSGYLRVGSGEPLLLIHGVGMNAGIWAPQIERLKRRFDVIALDLLGHGASPLPQEDAELTDFADQAISLLDHLRLASVLLVGHSMGALVAQEVALRAPERVRRLVSLNAVFRRPPELLKAVQERSAQLGPPGDSGAVAATLARWFGDPLAPELQPVSAKARATLESVDPDGYRRTYRLFARADSAQADRLTGLAVPALFMTGSEDRNSTPAMSAAMAALVPEGQCVVLRGERHMMALASPDLVTARLEDFLCDEAAQTGDGAQPHLSDPIEFRRALGSFLTGVTVVTTIGPEGEPRGFTANSFTSVSLDPPLVLVCIAKKALGHPVFAATGSFAINVLSEDQKAVSGIFASKARDKFAAVSWRRGLTGSPVIDGSVAYFDCAMENLVDAGDHSILLGRVRDFYHNAAQPLGYCRGAYVALGLSQEALAGAPPEMAVGAILEADGQVLFLEKDGALELPIGRGLGTAADARSLNGRLAAAGIDAHLNFLFAVWDDGGQPSRTHVYYRGTLEQPQAGLSGLRLVDIDRIAELPIADPAVRSMLDRYVRERSDDVFGVYVGSDREGRVQPLAKPAGPADLSSEIRRAG